MKMKVNAEKLRRWREERCWSQEHLAEIAGISLRTMQRIETGASASHESAKALAAVFDVELSALIVDIDGEVDKAVAREEAKKLLQLRMSFGIHLVSYVLVISILVMINLAQSPDRLWVLWPAIGWGIGVIAHGATAYLVGYISRMEKQINDVG